jgi:hypothetical protein
MASAPSLDSGASLFAKCVKVARENGRGRPGATPGRPLARLPASDLLRFRREDFRGGPTRDVVRTTHVGPHQTAGPTAWPNRIYASFVAKNPPPAGFPFSAMSAVAHHGAHTTDEWPICHGVSRRAFNERGESGIRNILNPATSGNPSAASADTKARTAAGTSPLINRLIAFV